jgi:phage shock protein PspC (stress-responsive transcriptional regulator)
MQRVVSINLNGSVYQLEENGYNALFAYLDAADVRLKDNPDRVRLLADLERAIAEKCQASLGPHSTVVTAADIARILSEMEPVAGPAAREEPAKPGADPRTQNATSGAAGTPPGDRARTSPPPHKRLWQIREGGMIGGVCLGIATFFNIDVTLVRILFAVFALSTGGWGILAYLGLMFILPRATNTAEAAAPAEGSAGHQWPWDDGWPWDKHGWPWDKHGWPWDKPGTQSPAAQPMTRDERREWRYQRRAGRMASPPQSLAGTIVIAFFVMLAFGWLSYWMRGAFIGGWPLFWGGPFFWGAPHWVGIVLFFVFFRFLMLPLRTSRGGWYGHPVYGHYVHPYNPWLAMWHGIVWVGTIIFMIWLAYEFVPGVHEFIRQFQAAWPDGRFDV